MELTFETVFTNLGYRKTYHFAGGVLLFLGVYLLTSTAFYIAAFLYFAAFLALAKRVSFAVLGVALLFALTASRAATMGAIVVFTLGDGFAALVGHRYDKTPLPWNAAKTVAGSIAFLASSLLGLFLFWSVCLPAAPWPRAVLTVAPTVAGCIAESLPISFIRDREPNDNLVLILVAGLSIFFLLDEFAVATLPLLALTP